MDSAQRDLAGTLRALHEHTLVLPNAWDAASAAIIASAGAPAIATTSGGMAWSAGDVAATVRAVIAAGAVGINLEDSRVPGGPLFDVAAQAERVRAARDEAVAAGLPGLWINVRTDVYLFGIGQPEDRLADVLSRARAFAGAGADSLFVPGLIDLDVLRTLVRDSPLPVNVMVWPGAPTVAELEAVGVRRISVGTAIAQVAYGTAHSAAVELLTKGTYGALAGGLDFGTVNSAVTR
jgi:2-methylisocitrate lyase-like PEP mutase family enzyme